MDYLKKQIYFVASTTKRMLVGMILCFYLSFIIIVLEPFDTDQFEAEYRLLLLSGYGLLVFLIFIIQGTLENIWYSRNGKIWRVANEIYSGVLFCVFSGHVLYFYNTVVINLRSCTFGNYKYFLFSTIVAMLPVFFPLMLYLRQKFGERLVSPAENVMKLVGENKNEILRLDKQDLLFVKAVENYVEICFVDANKKFSSKTFRQTLSNVNNQLPFLEKCHRSYLVNNSAIREIVGNSQGAKISFKAVDKEIPLSKTYYKHIKSGIF